jgi:hypothetical protein
MRRADSRTIVRSTFFVFFEVPFLVRDLEKQFADAKLSPGVNGNLPLLQ